MESVPAWSPVEINMTSLECLYECVLMCVPLIYAWDLPVCTSWCSCDLHHLSILDPCHERAVDCMTDRQSNTHTKQKQKKQKAKCLAATKVTRTWRSQDTCTQSGYCVPVLRNLLEPGKELAGAPTVALTAGVGTQSPTTPLVLNETQPVYFAPRYKTRYPFSRWVGWWACDFFSSFSRIRTGVLWVISPRLYQLNHQGIDTHTHTHTHTHTRTHTHTHTHYVAYLDMERVPL